MNNFIKIILFSVVVVILFSGTSISQNIDINIQSEQKIEDSGITGVVWAYMIGFITDLVEHEDSIEFQAIFVYHSLFITIPGRGFIGERRLIRNHEKVILDLPKGIINERFILVSYNPEIPY